MTRTLRFFLAAVLLTASGLAADGLHLPAKPGPANGKRIVLIAGDEEYRSEETCPMLAKILSQKHGFDCTVLFAINPDGGYVDPNYTKNIPGLAALDSADLLIIGTRFRQLPADQLARIAAFLNAGKPVIGFRTATHAFTGDAATGDFKWADFGLRILGEKWVSHHGRHKIEGTRAVVEPANGAHEVLRGVAAIFAPSDVYTVANLDPKAATILLRGAVTESLDPASPAIAGPKNDPMMPLAWLREYTAPNGSTKGRAFCTTLGASVDFADEDLRRLVVNAAYHLVHLPVPQKADVGYVDAFTPTFYGFIREPGYYQKLNLKPESYALGQSPATGLPASMTTKGATPSDKGAGPKKGPATKKGPPRKTAAKKSDENGTAPGPHAQMDFPRTAESARPQVVAPPSRGERIVFIGNGLVERDNYYSRLETELHLRYPEQELFVRNLGRAGDTPGFRPHPARVSQWAFPGAEKFRPEFVLHNGKGFFPMPDQWLTFLKADTVVAFFGLNESFDGPNRVDNFEAELDAFAQHTLSKAYNGREAPRLVLVSPIAFENLSAERDLPAGLKENVNLALYTAAMERVAKKRGLTFVDLFHPTLKRYRSTKQPFTINGFAPTDAGYRELAVLLGDGMFGAAAGRSTADPKMVHAAVKEKDWLWNNDYNLVNGVHTHGQRYAPYGPQNYPDEIRKTREMMVLRDTLIHQVAAGIKKDLAVDDAKTHALPPVASNFKTGGAMGSGNYEPGDKVIANLKIMDGFKVELFASEREFPDLTNPVQMSFDNRGRLWVAVMPTYPHWRPGDPRPNDKLLIFEDTDGDGRADKQTVFADGLHLPIGFEIAPEGVYLSQEPNLCLLIDDDKDDRADRMEILLHGFDTHDTHHAISAYCADASGAFYLCEGRFLHSQIETPYGPRRCNDGGVWRFDPKSFRLERYSQTDVNNPWGISFDYWEQCFISDASNGLNWWGLPISAKMPYGIEIDKSVTFVPKRSRPTSGAEFVSSRHFPDHLQGQFMICNSIGFLGIGLSSTTEDGAGFTGKLAGDLVSSNDPNYRPVDLEFAPDGSLYFLDWHNALIGHMQHNARDPNRDHEHGRIYRITYPGRPLVKPAKVAGASIPELLENLKLPEYRTRYRTRRELRGRPAAEVIRAVKAWAAKLDRADPNYEHHLCEAMWVTWAQNRPDVDLIKQCLGAKQHQARAAAVSVVRFAADKIPNASVLLLQAAGDSHPRVRLESIVAASWLDDPEGARVVFEAMKLPLDQWMGPVTKQILEHTLKDDVEVLRTSGMMDFANNASTREYLAGNFKFPQPPKTEEQKSYGPARELSGEDLRVYKIGQEVYLRDAHCATCHQPNGQGMPNIYPPLAKSDWLGDDERLIKIALKGLWGPIEVAGQHFDPTKGVPPMMGFGEMLNDNELAAVLSYIRQSFGNDGELVTAEAVRKLRAETKPRINFYMVEEILKEHPMAK
ncbi:MAG: ThuA domain-containing protein [Opitutaceae bacterium]|nr:ThuA domain-containing protein [Opitutaceae bacterium]